MTDRRIAIVRNYEEFIAALRARVDQLQLTHDTLDAVSGIQAGYSGKLFAPVPIKNLGPVSLGPVLGALGLCLVVIEDRDALARIAKRLTKRLRPRHASDAMLPIKKRKRRGFWHGAVGEDWSRVANARRQMILSPAARKRIARKAAAHRWQTSKVINAKV